MARAAPPIAAKKWGRVAIYARISKKDDQTVEQQVEALEPWARAQASDVVVVPEEESSRKNRPKLDALRTKLMAGEFDALVVWKLDRIARNAEELLRWRRERDAVGFDLVSYSQAIDLATPEGRLMYTIMAGFAEYERDVISQRTKFKLDHLRTRGVFPGGGKGYDEAHAERLAAKNLSDADFGEKLGVSKATANRIKKRLQARGGPRLRPLPPTRDQQRIHELEGRVKALSATHVRIDDRLKRPNEAAESP